VATLASSPQAAAEFETIRDAWADPDHTTTRSLRARLERFIAQYPKDGLIPLARVALALVAMRDGDLAAADAELAPLAHLPPGTARELWTVARARRLRLSGDPDGGLALLRPFVGKSVDPIARAIYEEELTLTALATHRDYEAISYMDTWLRASTPDEKPRTITRVSGIVEKLPKEVLVGSLQSMSSQRGDLGYGVDIERILAQRLAQIATSNGDAELARALLEADPRAFALAGDAGTALGELASSRRGLNVVEGRTLGLLLPTESPALRDESADVLRGVLWALGLPRGARDATPTRGAVPSSAQAGACGPLEAAPDPSEPGPADNVHLVSRDDAGSADRTEVSLDELAGEGAAIVVAGLDAQTADRALRWGDNHGVPVIAIVPIADDAAPPTFGFVLGEPRTRVVEALVHAEPTLATEGVSAVADASELEAFPGQGGRFGGLSFGPPVSCDIPAAQAGEPRFPIGLWESEKTHSWVVSGSPECGTDLVNELAGAHIRGVVALTLEAAARTHGPPGLQVLSAQAGVVPEADPSDPRADEVRRFTATLGHAGWWTALGRDAAVLARTALLGLPVDTVSEPHAVTVRRAMARDALAVARARLWTSESAGWSQDRTVKRNVCLAGPAR
jgi:hypothetical protein